MHSSKTSSNQNHSLDDLGDCIGMESGVDLKSDLDMEGCNTQNCVTSNQDHHQFWGVKKEKKGKEYPPPMPHTPWVMKRYYTSDGRLIINEEKVERQDYFQAHRSNGRLILNLIPFDDTVSNDDDDEDEGNGDDDDDNKVNHAEEEVEKNREVQIDGFDDVGTEEIGQDRTVEDESNTKLQEFGVLSKCYNYDTVASSSSMFSIRPVHT